MILPTVSVEPDADQGVRRAIQSGLDHSNAQATGDGHFDLVLIAARDENANVVGGVVGEAYWGWVNFTTVWVHPSHRMKGLATQMLAAAEVVATQKGCTQAYLDTFSFQSPGLYRRAGYEVFGQLDDFPLGSTRMFLRKTLTIKPRTETPAGGASNAADA